MIYEVPNRGGNAISTTSLLPGVTYVQSGWQGDLLTQCATRAGTALSLHQSELWTLRHAAQREHCSQLAPKLPLSFRCRWQLRTASCANGSNSITGQVYGHIKINTTGSTGQLVIYGSAYVPYQPAGYNPTNPSATLSTSKAQFWSLTSQTTDGVDGPKTPITNWTWANCPTGPPGTPNPYYICLSSGSFNPTQLYEMVFHGAEPAGAGNRLCRDARLNLVPSLRNRLTKVAVQTRSPEPSPR